MTDAADRPEPVFEKGQLVRLRRRPEMEGPVVGIDWNTIHAEAGYQPRWCYRTSWSSVGYPASELEPVPDDEQSALIEQLAVSLAEAEYTADVDGFGREGAGYNWRAGARALLQDYDITPKHTVD